MQKLMIRYLLFPLTLLADEIKYWIDESLYLLESIFDDKLVCEELALQEGLSNVIQFQKRKAQS